MCFSCGDMIEMCTEGTCHNPNGGPFGKYKKFYLGAEYCEHLKLKYGHDKALWEDRYGDDDDLTA